MKQTYEQMKAEARRRIARQLRKDIAAYDGTARTKAEVNEGLEAAKGIGPDTKPFERAFAARVRELAGHHGHGHHRRRAAG